VQSPKGQNIFSSNDNKTYQDCWYGVSECCVKISSEKIDWKVTVLQINQRTLDVDDADPRPVHDRVPHVDRHHIGSSPDGARPVHEWIHRCTSGTRSPRLRHEFFHTLNIDVHRS
jgi:hypothetical protein